MHRRALLCLATFAAAYFNASPAHAHHEAIFGPQSALLFSGRGFASFQGFSARKGPAGSAISDSTFILSGGFSPWALPLSFVLALPVGFQTGADHGEVGLEDAFLGARYRFDLEGLQERFDAADNYVLAMVGAEVPTAVGGHAEFGRNLGLLTALLGSVEYVGVTVIGFGFAGLQSPDSAGAREGHELFTGGGLGYTPIDGERGLLSFQMGLAQEWRFRDRRDGQAVDASGGSQLMLSPTVVAGFGGRWLVFALATAPVRSSFRQEADRDRWRVGLGVVYGFGGAASDPGATAARLWRQAAASDSGLPR